MKLKSWSQTSRRDWNHQATNESNYGDGSAESKIGKHKARSFGRKNLELKGTYHTASVFRCVCLKPCGNLSFPTRIQCSKKIRHN